MKPENALRSNTDQDLTECSLEDAILMLGPAWIYELTVSSSRVLEAKNLLRRLCAQYVGNPFSPYINMRVGNECEYDEWHLEANGKAFWSPGA